MKDLIDEIDSRIKSPLFGYFIFSSFALNWEELFYLVVHNGPVSDRIAYFNNGTDSWTLFFYPILLAVIYSLLYPWLQYVFMLFNTKPKGLQNSLQAQSEHKLLIKKQELEKARSNLLEETEIELIERAKRDSQLDDIEDKNVREKLQFEIDNLREERDDLRGSLDTDLKVSASPLSMEEEEIIRLITSAGGSMSEGEILKASDFDKVKTEYYLEDLESNKYLNKEYDIGGSRGYYYDLTTKSKKIMVDKGVVK
jgi:hypothetical protein